MIFSYYSQKSFSEKPKPRPLNLILNGLRVPLWYVDRISPMRAVTHALAANLARIVYLSLTVIHIRAAFAAIIRPAT